MMCRPLKWKRTTIFSDVVLMRHNGAETADHGCVIDVRVIWLCTCVRWRPHHGGCVWCVHLAIFRLFKWTIWGKPFWSKWSLPPQKIDFSSCSLFLWGPVRYLFPLRWRRLISCLTFARMQTMMVSPRGWCCPPCFKPSNPELYQGNFIYTGRTKQS